MKTLVIGASIKPDRYSNKAIKLLRQKGHEVIAIGLRNGFVNEVEITNEKKIYSDIHTVTLYLNPKNQEEYYDYILKLKPKRVIFNPGAENINFYQKAKNAGIQVENACTLVMLRLGEFEKMLEEFEKPDKM